MEMKDVINDMNLKDILPKDTAFKDIAFYDIDIEQLQSLKDILNNLENTSDMQ